MKASGTGASLAFVRIACSTLKAVWRVMLSYVESESGFDPDADVNVFRMSMPELTSKSSPIAYLF